MPLISVSCSESVLFSSPNPPLIFSSFSHGFFRNGRIYAKCAAPETDTASRVQLSTSTNVGSASTSFLSLLFPSLKLFSGSDTSDEQNHTLEVATSSLSSLARFPWGSRSLLKGSHTEEINNSNPPILCSSLNLISFPD